MDNNTETFQEDGLQHAKIILDNDFIIDKVDERLFGSFIEHLGRAVYGGIYAPDNHLADEKGMRRDVINLVKKLNVPIVRYPGGNFVSGFNWEDSIGPKEDRPARLDLAWQTTEPNEFGLHEFYYWAEKVGCEINYAVNLGTRGPDAARSVVEYCNHDEGTYWSDLRKKNGMPDPMKIKTWCLGNEMDGPWQMGQKTPYEYGRIANEAAKMMRWVDSSIELVACGSSSSKMPTFGAWEMEMLDQCYENIDYVSLHRYYQNDTGDPKNFIAQGIDLDAQIKAVASICDAVGAKKKSNKSLNLSFDEWNVWYHSNQQDKEILKENRWGQALPLLEDVYTFEDAILFGSMLITLLRNSNRVKIACLAQLVNVIAPIMTSERGSWMQTIYWPFFHASKFGRGTALLPIISSPKYDTNIYSDVPLIDAVAVKNDDDQSLNLFVINRSFRNKVHLKCSFRGFVRLHFIEHLFLHHKDPGAVNTEAEPDTVVPKRKSSFDVDDENFYFEIPPLSWNVIRLSKGKR